jgi:hypothetical protein
MIHVYIHFFKHVHNIWITEPLQGPSFQVDGAKYKAYWKDIRCQYETESKTPLIMTKPALTAVVPRLCRVCHLYEKCLVA